MQVINADEEDARPNQEEGKHTVVPPAIAPTPKPPAVTEETKEEKQPEETRAQKEEKGNREGWPPPFLLFFLKGMGRCLPSFFLLLFTGLGDGRPPPSLFLFPFKFL